MPIPHQIANDFEIETEFILAKPIDRGFVNGRCISKEISNMVCSI